MEKYRPEPLQSKTDMANKNEKVVGRTDWLEGFVIGTESFVPVSVA